MELLNRENQIQENFLKGSISEIQNNFLQSKLGQITNLAIDEGLKHLLPDFIEDEVIDIKNALVNEGLDEAVHTAIDKAVQLGKTIEGVFTGNFESISQAQNAIKKGGVIDGISDAIDFTVKKLNQAKIIPDNIAKTITNGKKIILNDVEKEIKNEFSTENKSLDNLEKYIENWKNKYKEKDLEGLNKEYKKIKKEEKNILPIKNIINNIEKINEVQSIIKNSENFDFDQMYLDLAEKLNK